MGLQGSTNPKKEAAEYMKELNNVIKSTELLIINSKGEMDIATPLVQSVYKCMHALSELLDNANPELVLQTDHKMVSGSMLKNCKVLVNKWDMQQRRYPLRNLLHGNQLSMN